MWPKLMRALAPLSRLAVCVPVLLVVALAAYFVFFSGAPPPSRQAPRDPRLDYAGPFLNVHPKVRYVADERCADCHAEIAKSYAGHPMGRSLLPVSRAPSPPEDKGHRNPFDALGSRFVVERQDGRLVHRRSRLDAQGRPVAELEWDVHYVIGSGRRGHSYLSERDGYLFETPISWYSQKQRWDLSPGFSETSLTGRPALADCLFCHANRANHVAGSVNRYQRPVFDGHAIGCQRCHGPGELHVARRAAEALTTRIDYTIVNPRHLEGPLREAVCQQCHLTGQARTPRRGRGVDDFRPGLPLDAFWSVFVAGPEPGHTDRAVGHVEQMYASACFQRGAEPKRMGCTSCHDPHEQAVAAQRVPHYRQSCLACHEQKGCSVPQAERLRKSAQDSCIDCHMPSYLSSDIPHTASTDHRIPRHGKAGVRNLHAKALTLVSFYRQGKEDADDERDRAVAFLALAGGKPPPRDLDYALKVLEAAVARDPDDVPAAQSRGYALALQDRWPEALAVFEAVVSRAPANEPALSGAAWMAEASGRAESAIEYWGRAAALNPFAPEYRRRLTLLLINKAVWPEAQRECEAWLRLDPMSAEARTARVQCLLAAGKKEEARAEFARLEALAPPNLQELQIRFERRLK